MNAQQDKKPINTPRNKWRVTGAGTTVTTNSMKVTLLFLNTALRANDPAERPAV